MKNIDIKKRWISFGDTDNILSETKNFALSPFGMTEDGLKDFRGISLKTVPIEFGGGWESLPQKIDLISCDFSESRWEGFDLEHVTVEHSKFKKSKFFGNIFFYEVLFSDCIFESCSFTDVNFTKSSLVRTQFLDLKTKGGKDLSFNANIIDGCHFSGDMKKIRFNSSPIKKTSFAGILMDCTFRGNPEVLVLDNEREIYGILEPERVKNRMEDVDFSEASIVLCTFSTYCYLDKATPPSIDKNCIIKLNQCFFDFSLQLIKKEMSPDFIEESIMWLETYFKPDPRTPYGVIGPQDLSKSLGTEKSIMFFDILRKSSIETDTMVRRIQK